MRRRALIAMLGGATFTALAGGRAQQKPVPVVGYLSTIVSLPALLQLRRGLAETGFVEGRNVRIEYRMAEGHYDRLPVLAAELAHCPLM